MTDDELKALVASLADRQQETLKMFDRLDRLFQETDRQIQASQKETDKQLQETGKHIDELRLSHKEHETQMAELRLAQKETDRQLRETDKQLQETGKHIDELRLSHKEHETQMAELRLSQKETDRQLRETDKQLQETGKHIDELRLSHKEHETQMAELRLSQKETDRQLQETDRQLKETDRQLRRQLKELGKQIGGLGEKFGGFTEGMAFPSMTKILTERFGMEFVTPRVKIKKGGDTLELDVFAYANSERNEAFIVEVKSHLRPEGITQLQTILKRFRQFAPEHKDKKLYGMLAVVDASEDLRQEALANGFYMAGIHDEQFIIETPKGFKPKSW